MRASPHPWPPSQETGTTVSLDETDRAVHKASLRRQLLADALMHGRNEHEENRLRRSQASDHSAGEMAGVHAQLPRRPKHVRQAGRRQSRGHGSVAGADAFAAPPLVQEAGSRTASTTLTIASITSCGCSLWISWPLFVFVMCLALETGLASFSCAVFCAASVT